MTAADLYVFINCNKLDGNKNVNVKIQTIPESIGGPIGIQNVSIKKCEIEDDGTLTIVVEQ